jgi:Photosynthesis system II assembly factor YCF48
MPHDDLDVKFEKALAGHLRGRSEKTRSCMDAETLAAYQHGVLPEPELLQAKEHIVTCDRCQEILALSAEPGPTVAVMPASPRHAAQWRWLAPVGAIAAALVLWIATHNRNSVPAFDLAKNQSQSEPAGSNESPLAMTRHGAPLRSDTLAPSEQAKTRKQEMETKSQKQPETAPVATSSAAPVPAAPVPKTNRARDAGAPANAVSSLPEMGRAYSPVPPAQADADAAAALTSRQAPPANVAVTESQAAVSGAIAGARTLQKAKKDSVDFIPIPTPVGKVLWRVAAAGLIQRSTDGGTTWTNQTSGVVVDLLSGSAPSETVCWVAGRSGTILRTIDAGQHWQKIEPPVNAEISGVLAVSEQQATVTLAGQSYQTLDGGQTWAVLPGSSRP